MKSNTVEVKADVKIDGYRVIADAIEVGISCGLRRADKHANDQLTDIQRARVQDHVEIEVLNALCNILKFE